MLVAPVFAGCRAAAEPALGQPLVVAPHQEGPAIRARSSLVKAKTAAVAVLESEDVAEDDDSGDDAFPPPEVERTPDHTPRALETTRRDPKRGGHAFEHRTPPERPPTRA
jgi:L-alanine-DL-glutamate epimerase-like enolase superfamily enzyme